MTAQEFLINKGVESVGNQFPAGLIRKWLEEYANIVLSVAADKAEIAMKKKSNYGKYRKWQNVKEDEVDLYDYEVQYFVDKNSILNCLK